jgi:CubicO group peptidase (beta-lactamase class C family)
MPPVATRIRFAPVLGAVLLAIAVPASAADAGLERRARQVLAEHVERDGPGVAAAVLERGELRLAVYRGLADIDTGTPIDGDTLFDLASVSKQMTAVAVLQLVGAGEIDLDAPVGEVIEDFAVPERGRAITPRDLLQHLSGLPDYSGDAFEDGDEAFRRLTTETHLDWLNQQRALRPPGRRFEYNNSGYALLALLVERASGQRFRDYLRGSLFAAAGMPRSEVLDRLDRRFPRQASGYRSGDGEVEPSTLPTRITGDGNVYSSLTEMIAWCRALDGRVLLAPSLRRQLFENGSFDNGEPIDEEGDGYGFGWYLDGGGDGAYHSGSWYGSATYLARQPSTRRWVIVLSNDEDVDAGAIGEALLALAH